MIKNKSMLKLTIYWTGFASMINMAIHPIASLIGEEFPNVDFSTISMITTIGSCMLAILAFTSGKLIEKFGKKQLMIIGAVLATIGGAGGSIVVSIPVMMLMRCILGAGCGILLTTAMILIPLLFPDPKEYTKIEGANAAICALIGVYYSVFSGKIGTVNWRLTYLLYLVFAVQLILVILYVPSDDYIKELEKTNNSGKDIQKKPANKNAVLLGVEAIGFSCITTLIFSWCSVLVGELNIGGSVEAGYMSSMLTGGSFVGGLVFVWLFNKFRLQTSTWSFALMAIGTFICLGASGLLIVLTGAFVFGVGYGVYFPFIYGRAADYSVPENLDSNMAVVNGLYYLGIFGSSWFTKLVSALSHNDTGVFNFKVLGCGCVIFLVYYALKGVYEKKNNIYIK